MSFIISGFNAGQRIRLVANVPLCLTLSSAGTDGTSALLLRRMGGAGAVKDRDQVVQEAFSSLLTDVVF